MARGRSRNSALENKKAPQLSPERLREGLGASLFSGFLRSAGRRQRRHAAAAAGVRRARIRIEGQQAFGGGRSDHGAVAANANGRDVAFGERAVDALVRLAAVKRGEQ